MLTRICACVSMACGAQAQVLYDVVDLTDGAGFAFTEARAINDTPRVAGFAVVGEKSEVGLVWADGEVILELAPLLKDTSTAAVGINSNDVPAGVSEEVFFMGKDLYEDQKAVVWQGATPINVEDIVAFDPELDPRFARDVNDANDIVGYARLFGGPPHELRGFLAADGELTDLGALTRPEAISNEGTIVGYAIGEIDVAYKWAGGKATSLDHPAIEGEASRAFDVSDADVIVGDAEFVAGGPLAPAIWVQGVPSPVIDASTPGTARSINGAGDVVGWTGEGEGFVRIGDSVRPLLDLIAPGQGWEQLRAHGINGSGMIVGAGVRDGEAGHAFMLVPRCGADFNGDDETSILDFVAFQQAFVSGHPAADVNTDGILNVLDFVAFQLVFVDGC